MERQGNYIGNGKVFLYGVQGAGEVIAVIPERQAKGLKINQKVTVKYTSPLKCDVIASEKGVKDDDKGTGKPDTGKPDIGTKADAAGK